MWGATGGPSAQTLRRTIPSGHQSRSWEGGELLRSSRDRTFLNYTRKRTGPQSADHTGPVDAWSVCEEVALEAGATPTPTPTPTGGWTNHRHRSRVGREFMHCFSTSRPSPPCPSGTPGPDGLKTNPLYPSEDRLHPPYPSTRQKGACRRLSKDLSRYGATF